MYLIKMLQRKHLLCICVYIYTSMKKNLKKKMKDEAWQWVKITNVVDRKYK